MVVKLLNQGLALFAFTFLICAASFAQKATNENEYKARVDAISKLVRAEPLDWPVAEARTEAFLTDYPRKFDPYLDMMWLVWNAEMTGKRQIERKLAAEMAVLMGPDPSETPDWAGSPVAWAKGAVNRLDLEGQHIEIQFTAIDGQKVDLASLNGKVVLIDFWATWCPPCLASLPRVKECYDKYHAKGFEVVGISWDNDQATLAKFLTAHAIPWPQHFEGSHRKFGEQFGIGGIPYLFLVDKQGRLRLASAFFEESDFSSTIPKLLAE